MSKKPAPKPDVEVKITAAVAIGGNIIKPGKIILLPYGLAQNLLQRGRAELAGDERPDAKSAEAELKNMSRDQLNEAAADYELEGIEKLSDKDLRAALLIEATA